MMQAATNATREAAVKLAELGFHVFPCSGKVPATEHGVHDARSVDAPFAKWWPDGMRYDLAIAMGRGGPSGKILFGIDIDPRHNGIVEWAKLVAGRDVPETVTARSGRGDGGIHLYFFASPGWTDFPKSLCPGVDTKGPGGYLMAPPSLHTDTGEAYSWERDPWSTAIADAPAWLLDEMLRGDEAAPAAAPVADYFITGERNDMLTSVAGSIRRRGMQPDEIAALLLVVNRNRCRPPLPDHEVWTIAKSAGRNMDAADPVVPSKPGESLLATPILSGIDLAKPLPPVEYFCEQLGLPCGPGAPHIFCGFGYSGKTLVHQMMNLSLAAGRNIWKRFQRTEGDRKHILHVDNEQGQALTQRRYQRGANAMGESLEALPNLECIVYPKLKSGRSIKLIKEHRAAWVELMTGRDLMLVDSFDASRDMGVSQNDSEVRAALDLLGDLSEETKCRGSVIHHANKGSLDVEAVKDPRLALSGSQAIFAAGDSVYLLAGAKGEAIRIAQIKARSHGEPVDDFALVISDIAKDGERKWGLAVHVEGVELIDQQKAAKREESSRIQLERDAESLYGLIVNTVGGLSRDVLEAKAKLNGRRMKAALTHLAGRITVEEQKDGRAWKKIYRAR